MDIKFREFERIAKKLVEDKTGIDLSNLVVRLDNIAGYCGCYEFDTEMVKINFEHVYDCFSEEGQSEEGELINTLLHEIGHYIHDKYLDFEFIPQLQKLVRYRGDISNIELFAEGFANWIITDEYMKIDKKEKEKTTEIFENILKKV